MNPKTTKLIAKTIAILLVVALVVTSFSFVFFWGATPLVVYASQEKEPDWDQELMLIKEFIMDTKAGYKDAFPMRISSTDLMKESSTL